MGVNMCSSLLINKNTTNKDIPLRIPAMESYYISSLSTISELNESLRNMHIELHEMSSLNILSEANVLKQFTVNINKIIDSILAAINTVRKAIAHAIDAYIVKAKAKQSTKDIKELYKLIDDYYNHNMYFNMSVYSNSLKSTLTDSATPKIDADVTDMDIDRIVDTMNQYLKSSVSLSKEMIQSNMEQQKEKLLQNRIRLRKELTGTKSVYDADINDQSAFRQQLMNYYIGEKSDVLINHSVAIRAVDNMNQAFKYTDMIDSVTKTKNKMEKYYNSLTQRLTTFKKQANDIINNPEKHITGNDEALEVKVEQCIVIVAQTVIALSNTLNATMQDHLTSFIVKLECLNIMRNQDAETINKVIATIKASMGVKESVIIDDDNDIINNMNESLTQYCEGCFMLNEAYSRIEYEKKMYPHVLQEAENDNENFIDGIIQKIVTMFKNWLGSLKIITDKDKEWFDNNEQAIKDSNFKFPSEDGDIPDWVDFKLDRIRKSFDVPTFDEGNPQLMSDLESDESYSKFLYTKIGGSESDITTDEAKNGNFAMKCRALFGDGKEEKIKVSDLLNDRVEFFDYCQDYLDGENGGIYKSIQKDTKALDQSKKNVMRNIKKYNSSTEQENTKSGETKTSETSKSTTTDGNKTTTNTSETKTVKNESVLFDTNIDLAQILGLSESFNILNELSLPKQSDNPDKENKETKSESKILKEKASRFFTMTGNALGAKMTVSMKAYNQYKALFKWALKKNETTENSEETTTEETKTEETTSGDDSIISQASK